MPREAVTTHRPQAPPYARPTAPSTVSPTTVAVGGSVTSNGGVTANAMACVSSSRESGLPPGTVTGAGLAEAANAAASAAKKPGACAECKRLKLGCDRVWPCSSCKRRKVAHLCPEGQLESKEINLAQRQIKGLLDRIGSLEALLRDHDVEFEAFNPKDDPTFNFDAVDHMSASEVSKIRKGVRTGPGTTASDAGMEGKGGGQLRIARDGSNEWHGLKASASHDFSVSKGTRSMCIPEINDDDIAPFLNELPDEAQCRVHIHNYFVNCDWMHRLLQEDEHMADWAQYWSSPLPKVQRLPRHKMAVNLLVLALGYVSELDPRADLQKPDNWVRGAQLCLGGLGVGFTVGVTLDTVAALNLLAQYLLNADARDSASAAWNVIGVTLRLCQSMGLHYVGTWDEQDIDYRQRLWWETIAMDRFLSLSLGRPYMARSSQTAWPIALDTYGYVREGVKRAFSKQGGDFTTPSSLPFHWFKYRLCIILDQCMNDLDSPFAPRPGLVQKVNHSLHEIAKELPPFLRCEKEEVDPFAGLDSLSEPEQKKVVAQAHMFHLLVHTCHLALHRPFFVDEIKKEVEPDGPSFDQMVDSARNLTMTLRRVQDALPKLAMFWKSFVGETFTAAVVQAAVVVAAPTSPAAADAWADLRDSFELFQKFAEDGHSIAIATLPTLHTLYQDTADFMPVPRRSFVANFNQIRAKFAVIEEGKITTRGGVEMVSLLQMSSRYFPPRMVETAEVEAPRPPWLHAEPPPAGQRVLLDQAMLEEWNKKRAENGHLPAGPQSSAYGATLQPGAPAARYASGRFDGPSTDWTVAQSQIDLHNLVAQESNVPHELLEQYVTTSRPARPSDFRAPFPLTGPHTSHVRRRDPEEWPEDAEAGESNRGVLSYSGRGAGGKGRSSASYPSAFSTFPVDPALTGASSNGALGPSAFREDPREAARQAKAAAAAAAAAAGYDGENTCGGSTWDPTLGGNVLMGDAGSSASAPGSGAGRHEPGLPDNEMGGPWS